MADRPPFARQMVVSGTGYFYGGKVAYFCQLDQKVVFFEVNELSIDQIVEP